MLKSFSKEVLAILVLLLSILSGFLIYSDFKTNQPVVQTQNCGNFTSTENEVLGNIKDFYLRDFPDSRVISESRAKGIVNSLGDPYSEYITAAEQKKFDESLNQKYQGIGVKLEKLDDRFLVVEVIDKSPALEKGVQKGDIIVKVNDDLITPQTSTNELVSKIRGPENSSVRIQFARAGQAIDLEIPRREIKGELIILDIKGDLAVIRIVSFGEGLDQKMKEVVSKIRSNPAVKKIAIDVRSDTGGLLGEALDVISYFVPAGSVLVQEKSKERGQTKTTELKSTPKSPNLIDYQTVVLTDRFSASASEILAGALRDIRGVKLYGEKTFGKGLVQKVFPLKNGDFVKLTIAEWLTPKGQALDKNGLDPDVKVDQKEDIFEVLKNR
jgi:carboxyl-terminal processing protease